MQNAMLAMEIANLMIDAADGFADDEMVLFRAERFSAGLLREEADALIDAHLDAWAVAIDAQMTEATRNYHVDF